MFLWGKGVITSLLLAQGLMAEQTPMLYETDVLPFFFFSHFWPPLWHIELLGQGSDLNHIRDLRLSCGNARSLTHCAGLGIEPMSQCCQDAANPIAPQWELRTYCFM